MLQTIVIYQLMFFFYIYNAIFYYFIIPKFSHMHISYQLLTVINEQNGEHTAYKFIYMID